MFNKNESSTDIGRQILISYFKLNKHDVNLNPGSIAAKLDRTITHINTSYLVHSQHLMINLIVGFCLKMLSYINNTHTHSTILCTIKHYKNSSEHVRPLSHVVISIWLSEARSLGLLILCQSHKPKATQSNWSWYELFHKNNWKLNSMNTNYVARMIFKCNPSNTTHSWRH